MLEYKKPADRHMQSPETPDDRRRVYFSVVLETGRGCWFRPTNRLPAILGSPNGRHREGDTDNDNIVQLRAFLQSLYKYPQSDVGTKIIQYCSAC